MGKQWKQGETLFSWAPKSLQMVAAAMKLKDTYSLGESYDQPRQHIKKQRHYFANKRPSSQSHGFFSVVMYRCERERNGNPLQYSCLENPMGSQRDATEQLNYDNIGV